jgi:hypothetical protein
LIQAVCLGSFGFARDKPYPVPTLPEGRTRAEVYLMLGIQARKRRLARAA